MRKTLPIALAAFVAALVAAVTILLRARASREEERVAPRAERVVSERPLDTMTRDELYELARELDIPGRSKMKKPELRDAVSRVERSG